MAKLKTRDYLGVDIFAVGKWNDIAFSQHDIQALVANTNEVIDELKPFLKLGHGAEQRVVRSSELPNAGKVRNIRIEGDKIFADLLGVPDSLSDIIEVGGYDQRSIEVYFDYVSAKTGKSYGYVIGAVALLGAEHPAVTVLDPMPMPLPTLNNLDDILATYRKLPQPLSAGGYRGAIEFRRQQQMADEPMRGAALSVEGDRSPEETIEEPVDDPIDEPETEEPEVNEPKPTPTPKPTPQATTQPQPENGGGDNVVIFEQLELIKRRLDRAESKNRQLLQEREEFKKKDEARDLAIDEAKIEMSLDALADEGRLLPKHRPSVKNLLMQMRDVKQPITFSRSDDEEEQEPALDHLLRVFSEILPVRVDFLERAFASADEEEQATTEARAALKKYGYKTRQQEAS